MKSSFTVESKKEGEESFSVNNGNFGCVSTSSLTSRRRNLGTTEARIEVRGAGVELGWKNCDVLVFRLRERGRSLRP